MRMRVAIFGASGFLGAALSQLLVRGGHEVFGLGRAEQRPSHLPKDVCWIPCDATREPPELPADCNAVLYLSQSQHYRQFADHADHVLAVNTAGAAKAAIAAVAANARFFCYASSGTVYAPSFDALSEDAPVRRDDGYALSKLSAEECLPLVAGDMALTCVRIFGLFGPGQTGMLVPRLHERIVQGEPITLESSRNEEKPTGGLRISLSYVEDAARCLAGLMHIASEKHILPKTLNLAGPRAVGIRELCETIGRVSDRTPVFQTLTTQRRFDLHADISRLRALLDPRFTDLTTALTRTFSDSGKSADRSARAG